MKEIKNKTFQMIFLLTTLGICLIYGSFILGEKLYIYLDIGADTYSSYWPYYVFYSDFVKGMNYGFWSFNFGLGGNILTTHNLLFDPFNIVLFLFNKENLDYGIIVVTILKVYFVSYYSYKFLNLFKISNYALIIATISYTFSGYFIVWGQHYHYATMFVLFTILLYYMERWIRVKDFKVLVIIISLLSINSPYFLYMICLFLSLYILCRYFQLYKYNLKSLVVFTLQTIGVFLLGFMLAAIILLPEIYTMLNSPRIGANLIPKIQFASIKEYISIISSLLSNNLLGTHYFNGYENYYEAPHLFIGTLLLLTFPILFSKNIRTRSLILISSIILIAIFIPNFSNPIFNAFSDYTYRWTFCIVPIFALALAKSITLIEQKKIEGSFLYKNIVIMYIGLISLLIIAYLYRFSIILNKENINIIKFSYILLISVLTGYLLVICLKWNNALKTRIFKSLLLLLVIVDLFGNSYIATTQRSIIASTDKHILPYFDNSNDALEYIKAQDDGFYRIFKTYSKIDLNDALFQNYYGDKIYNSLNNPYLIEFGQEFDVRSKDSLHYLVGYDDKSDLYNLLGFKYMLTKQKGEYFGFEFMKSFGDTHIYINNFARPLAFVYEHTIDKNSFTRLGMDEKLTNISTNAVVLSGGLDFKATLNEEYQKNVSLKPNIYTEGITINKNEFPEKFQYIADSFDPFIILTLEDISKKPLKINFTATSEITTNGKIYYKTLDSDYNEENAIPFKVVDGKKEYSFEINMLNISEIRLDLSDNIGEYILEDFLIKEKNVNYLLEQKVDLKENQLNIKYFSENRIQGEVKREKKGILFFSIPYDKGWKAKINGESVPVERVNYGFVGVSVPSGYSEIELYYEQNYFRMGCITTIVGVVIYLLLIFRGRKRSINR